jgi:hypothetical protein
MTVEKCALIGYNLKENELKPINSTTIEYETEYVGKVKITLLAYEYLLNNKCDPERYIIAGICKNRTLNNEEPILIDSEFINVNYKNENPPSSFDQKCNHLLNYIYENGGKENIEIELNSTKHFPLSFSNSEEFTRVVGQLENDHYIDIRNTHNFARGGTSKLFMGIKITSLGKTKALKALPKMPMYGLVIQEITTGNKEVDVKINHARKMFFDNPTSIDKMRSACETLSFVLEPIREELKNYFKEKDVSDFFQIVNSFDIRHNKESTKTILHEEQLEWVFYSLLNTINTYTKLKNNGK